MKATSPRPPSPGHSTLSASFFTHLLRPLARALRTARASVEEADRRYRKFFTRTHLASLVYFHLDEIRSSRSLVRFLEGLRSLGRLTHWIPTHLSCVADAHNHRDPAAFEAVLAALCRVAQGQVGHQFTVTAPTRPDLGPPGWYMLYAVSNLVNNERVPSVAHFVRLH